MRHLILIALAYCSFVSTASAQVKVFVDVVAKDSVGGRLAYALKEGIRRSASMQLVDREKDGFIRVSFITLDPDKSTSPNLRTIYSAVWTTQTFHDTPVTMYLDNMVGQCGSDRVAQCAESLVAETDDKVTFVRGLVQTMLEGNKNSSNPKKY